MHIKNLKIICNVFDSNFVIDDDVNFKNITLLNTIDFITEIIANVAMKRGIQQTFYNLLSFDGSEIYTKYCKRYNDKNFEWVFKHSKNGIPFGIISDKEFIFMPDNNFHPTKNDKLVYISENRSEYSIDENMSDFNDEIIGINANNNSNSNLRILIIGYNDEYKRLISCLKDINDCVIDVLLYDNDSNTANENLKNSNENFNVLGIVNYDNSFLEGILPNYDRVIVLRDPATIDNENIDTNDESTDENSIILSLKLRKIRNKLGLSFQTIISISNERNRNLIDICDDQDYIVGPNIVSMFLSQMALNFDLKTLMFELLDSKGIVLDVINSNVFKFKNNTQKFSNLKYSIFKYKMVLIGIYDNKGNNVLINPKSNEKIILDENISFIVIRDFDNKVI